MDNLLWNDENLGISEQLARTIPGSAVANLAADGFTSKDVLHGSQCVVSMGLRQAVGDRVPFDDDRVFRPLDALARLSPPPTDIVLSVGGNDVREILAEIDKLPLVVEAFSRNYPRILAACLAVTPRVTIMLQYRPCASHTMDEAFYGVYEAMARAPGPGDAVDKINQLMEAIYAPVLSAARAADLAVLDLPRTFDIHNDVLYSHQIEPSAAGGAVIARLVGHALAHHAAAGASVLYSADSSGLRGADGDPAVLAAGSLPVAAEPNTGGWAVRDAGGARRACVRVEGPREAQLLRMGFPLDRVREALALAGGDVQAAVTRLLN